MTNRATFVLHGFLNLAATEQEEVLDEIKKYYDSDYYEKKSIVRENERDFNNILTGPLQSGCACCGR